MEILVLGNMFKPIHTIPHKANNPLSSQVTHFLLKLMHKINSRRLLKDMIGSFDIDQQQSNPKN